MTKDKKSKYNLRGVDIRDDLYAGYLWYNKSLENFVVSAFR